MSSIADLDVAMLSPPVYESGKHPKARGKKSAAMKL